MDNQTGSAPRGIAFVFGAWLAGSFAASLIGRQESSVLASLMVLGAGLTWPVLYFILFCRGKAVNGDTPLRTVLIGGVILFSGASLFISQNIYTSLGYWIMNMIGFYIVINFSSHLDADGYAKGLRFYVLLVLPMLIGLAWYDYTPGMRLGEFKGPLNPNAISLVAVSVTVMACIFRNLLFRLVLIIPGAVIIYLTGSRASAIAVIIAWVMIFFSLQKGIGRMRAMVVIALITGVVSVIAVAAPSVVEGVDKFFAINDAHRGLSSGASGRAQTWQETWNLALENPLTGVGLRAHEALLKTNTSAHNGYLATLAEIGFIGFSCVMALIVVGMLNLLRNRSDGEWFRTQSVLLGLASGYMVLAIFERYLINLGNATSLLFLMSILFPRFLGRR